MTKMRNFDFENGSTGTRLSAFWPLSHIVFWPFFAAHVLYRYPRTHIFILVV
jgi:hypothetical protein